MSYRDRLHPWCVIRCLPQAQTLIIARFRKRNDAEAHLTTLRRLVPDGIFELVFDAEPEQSGAMTEIAFAAHAD
ncbi:MAG: hypothetical protein ACKO7W_22635 [Elainella sp.]